MSNDTLHDDESLDAADLIPPATPEELLLVAAFKEKHPDFAEKQQEYEQLQQAALVEITLGESTVERLLQDADQAILLIIRHGATDYFNQVMEGYPAVQQRMVAAARSTREDFERIITEKGPEFEALAARMRRYQLQS